MYDEEASAAERMDVVHEIDDRPIPVSRWVDAMRSLNTIEDPLARKLLALHRDCGTGDGECDSVDDITAPITDRRDWGCETTSLIAAHYNITYPAPRPELP